MNCIIANDKVLVVDSMMWFGRFTANHTIEDFMTPYGLLYPMNSGWDIVRMVQDAPDAKTLMSSEYQMHYDYNNPCDAVYLDWNSRLWWVRRFLTSEGELRTAINRIPQTSKPFFGCMDLAHDQTTAINLLLEPGMSIQEVNAKLETVTMVRLSSAMIIDYGAFKQSKPKGALCLPSFNLFKVKV